MITFRKAAKTQRRNQNLALLRLGESYPLKLQR
jgi:hypothetical protein